LEQEHHTAPVYSQIYLGIVYLEVMQIPLYEQVLMGGIIPAFINFKIDLSGSVYVVLTVWAVLELTRVLHLLHIHSVLWWIS